jgi:hypothetical protein
MPNRKHPLKEKKTNSGRIAICKKVTSIVEAPPKPRVPYARTSQKKDIAPTVLSASSPTAPKNLRSIWNTTDPTRPKDAMPLPRKDIAATVNAAISSTNQNAYRSILPINGAPSTTTTDTLSEP